MKEIINTHEQLQAAAAAGFDKRSLVGIGYHAPDRSNSRDVSVMKWSVFSPFFKTAPDAPWYDYGCKTFSLFGHGNGEQVHAKRKAAALKAAQEWAAQYGVTEWAKNRQGDYVAKEVNDKFPLRSNK